MGLSRTTIVRELQQLVGASNVVTDEAELKRSSIDRLRLYEDVHGVYTRPVPAAVVMARGTPQVADVLRFANQHRTNAIGAPAARRRKAVSRRRLPTRSCWTARPWTGS